MLFGTGATATQTKSEESRQRQVGCLAKDILVQKGRGRGVVAVEVVDNVEKVWCLLCSFRLSNGELRRARTGRITGHVPSLPKQGTTHVPSGVKYVTTRPIHVKHNCAQVNALHGVIRLQSTLSSGTAIQ